MDSAECVRYVLSRALVDFIGDKWQYWKILFMDIVSAYAP